ncbi:unnamed protein product [Onchocerca flexuosa]|uniref:PITH domain-containing protein n=1 Tax=Onchocerca flexuosa TaxID=387005 RepID=A0A183I0N5_9BILA|nr:unnamed protein product [Onchocerca flexuosa]
MENKGKWSLFASATDMNPFNGTIHNNNFDGNQNYRNSLIVTSPQFHVSDNEFEQFDLDNKHTYKEVSYNFVYNIDIINTTCFHAIPVMKPLRTLQISAKNSENLKKESLEY